MVFVEYESVIFDLDGVLVDSSAVVERYWEQWATRHDMDIRRVLQVAHGRRTADAIQLLAPHLDGVAEAASFAAEEAFDVAGLVKVDGAAEIVSSLQHGTWAVATSGTRDTAITRLKFAGLPIPSVLVTANDVDRGKPDPQGFLLAQNRLRAADETCIVVEDAPAGIEAARRAGMTVIAVASTHSVEDLKAADFIVKHLSDVLVQRERKALHLTVA